VMMGADFYQSLREIDENHMAGSPVIGIGRDTVITNAIIDINARIGDNVELTNKDNITEYISNDFEVRDGIIIVNKNSVIQSGTVF